MDPRGVRGLDWALRRNGARRADREGAQAPRRSPWMGPRPGLLASLPRSDGRAFRVPRAFRGHVRGVDSATRRSKTPRDSHGPGRGAAPLQSAGEGTPVSMMATQHAELEAERAIL